MQIALHLSLIALLQAQNYLCKLIALRCWHKEHT
jgi:hypothetical protein